MDDNKSKNLVGIMEYYAKIYFTDIKEEMKEKARKTNYFNVDPDMLDREVDDYIQDIVTEAGYKFSMAGSLILSVLASMKPQEIKEFELLFLDLLERTLFKSVKRDKGTPQAVFIITEPRKVGEEDDSSA